MKTHPVIMILGIALLAFATGASATDVRRAATASKDLQLVSSDRNLNQIIQERSRSSRGKAGSPSAVCATDGKVWSCAPENVLRNQSVIAADGARFQNRLDFGRLESPRPVCFCERDSDDEPFVCNPPGCIGTVDLPAVDARSIDNLTTPRDHVTTPREIQRQRGTPRPGN